MLGLTYVSLSFLKHWVNLGQYSPCLSEIELKDIYLFADFVKQSVSQSFRLGQPVIPSRVVQSLWSKPPTTTTIQFVPLNN